MNDRRREMERATLRALAQAQTLDEAVPKILKGICETLTWDLGALWILDRPGPRLRCVSVWRRRDRRLAAFEKECFERTFEKGEGLPGRVWETAEPLWINDVVHDSNFPRAPRAAKAELHAAFGFPITVRGELFGVMEFFSRETRKPDRQVLSALRTIGIQIGRLIEREDIHRELAFQKAILEAQGEAAPDAIGVLSADFRIVYWNQRLLEMFGLTQHDVETGDPNALIQHMVRQTADPLAMTEIAEAILSDPDATRRVEAPMADGRILDAWTAPVRTADGTRLGRVLYCRDVTDVKRTELALRERERWSAFLAEASAILASSLDYRASLEALAKLAAPTLADWCAVHIVEDDGTLSTIAVAHRDPARVEAVRELQERYPIDPSSEIGVPAVIRTGASVLYEEIPDEILESIAQDESHLDEIRALGLRSAMIVPLTGRDRTLGAFTLVSAESGRHYTKEDLRHAEDLARRASYPIETARLFEQVAEANRELTIREAVLESQGEAAIDGIVVLSADERLLYWNHRLVEIWEVPDELLRVGDPFAPIIEWMANRTADPPAFRELAAAVVADPMLTQRDEIRLANGAILDRWTAPVLGRDGTRLGRALYYRDITNEKRLEERLRSDEAWSSFLAEASAVLSESLDYETTLARVAELAVPTLGDWCTIHVCEPDGVLRPLTVAHVDPEKADIVRDLQRRYPPNPNVDVGVVAVIRSREPLLYTAITDEALATTAVDDEHLRLLRVLGPRSAIIVPIVCRGRVLGAMTMVAADSGRRYTDQDVRRVQELATRAAFPIDNARLYQEHARVATTLQQSLLPPRLPRVHGVEIAARYQPVAGAADVGGDFYDLFSLSTRTWGVFLGDVSGKGVEAAAVTSLARHTLRTAAMATHRPSQVLSMLNAALLEQTEPDRFCTAVFLVIEPRFGRLRVTASCGGHPVPYAVRSNGNLEPLACEGTLLGVVPEPELKDLTLDLDFGDKLFLYTDGILDVWPPDGSYGQERVEDLFRSCAKRGVEASADLIARRVLEAQGGEARDDFALVVLGVRASIFRRARTPRLWRKADDDVPLVQPA